MQKSGYVAAVAAWKETAALECGGGGAWLPEKPALLANDNVGGGGEWNKSIRVRYCGRSSPIAIRHDVAKHWADHAISRPRQTSSGKTWHRTSYT